MKAYLTLIFIVSIFTFSAQARYLEAMLPGAVCEKLKNSAGLKYGNQCIETIINKKTNPYANGICFRIAGASNKGGLECMRKTVGYLFKDVSQDTWQEVYKRSGASIKSTIDKLVELSIEERIQECINIESTLLIDEGVIINNDLSMEIEQSCTDASQINIE